LKEITKKSYRTNRRVTWQ